MAISSDQCFRLMEDWHQRGSPTMMISHYLKNTTSNTNIVIFLITARFFFEFIQKWILWNIVEFFDLNFKFVPKNLFSTNTYWADVTLWLTKKFWGVQVVFSIFTSAQKNDFAQLFQKFLAKWRVYVEKIHNFNVRFEIKLKLQLLKEIY